MLRHAAALCLCLLAACRVGQVEPKALLGPAPQTVIVWPQLPPAHAEQGPSLLSGLDAALRSRGYDVRSLSVGRQMLAEAGLLAGSEPAFARIGAVLGIDAVMQLEVGDFTVGGDRLQWARWDLGWRLVSTQGHGVLWQFSHHGNWQRRGVDTSDPMRPFDAEPEIVPFGGRGAPDFHDVADLAAWLHRFAMEHLPRAGA
ncbi:MAG TPA: hypothetical protein VFZ65_00715 [Planctomycetota bacterium]|nr:hypothetical protein [Planctomycetota bacterium]